MKKNTTVDMHSNGVPENTNPFTIIQDQCIDDGILERIAPQYFAPGSHYGGCDTWAPAECTASALSQEDAERLVAELSESDPLGSFAVREHFKHIIPKYLRTIVHVSRRQGEVCNTDDCYYI